MIPAGSTAKPSGDMMMATGQLAVAKASADDGSMWPAVVVLNEVGEVALCIPLTPEGARELAAALLECVAGAGLAS